MAIIFDPGRTEQHEWRGMACEPLYPAPLMLAAACVALLAPDGDRPQICIKISGPLTLPCRRWPRNLS
jgi:hypothetical protein